MHINALRGLAIVGTVLATQAFIGETCMAQDVTVPMRLIEGRPVVDVILGHAGPFPFVVDTGAGATVLNADLVEEAGIPSGGDVMLGDPTGGGGTPGRTHSLPAVIIGSRRFLDVFAVSWQDTTMAEGLGGARGVLGVASLAGVVVEFDFPAMELRLHTRHLEEGDGSMAYANPQSVIPSVTVAVGGQQLEAHVDTGNGHGIGLPLALRTSVTFVGDTEMRTARSASASFSIETGRIAETATVGGMDVATPMVFLNDRFPNANVGTAVLLESVLTVDVGRRRVRLVAAPR